jgi:hypothetical protein
VCRLSIREWILIGADWIVFGCGMIGAGVFSQWK